MYRLIFPDWITESKDYYGRAEQLEQIKNALSYNAPCVILGERRTGKTSTLHVITNYLKETKNPRYIPLIVEQMQDETFKKLTLRQFARIILGKLTDSLGKSLRDTGYLDENDRLRVETPEQFEEAFSNIIKVVEGAASKFYVLAIDEFDAIIELAPESDLIQELITHLLMKNSTLPIVVFLTMTRLPEALRHSIASPVLSGVKIIHLRPLVDEELRTMVDDIFVGLSLFQTSHLEWLLKMSGGYPYYIKLLLDNFLQLYGLGKTLPTVTAQMLQAALEKAVTDLGALTTLVNIYEMHFAEEERRLVLLLAYLKETALPVGILKEINTSCITAANQMVSRGYLVKTSEYYDFRIRFWGDWLRGWANFEEECENLNLDLHLKYINRPSIEIDERENKVRVKGSLLEATHTEYKLLLVLAQNLGHLVRRNTLVDKVWSTEHLAPNVLDTTIGRLRSKLEERGLEGKKYIELVRGEGYILHDAYIIKQNV